MKKRAPLKKYVLHILPVSAADADAFDLPMEQNALISCTRRGTTEFLRSGNVPHRLMLEFPDDSSRKAPGAFGRAHAREILRFLQELPDSVTDLYVCCSKGESRSPGLAAALLKGSGRKDGDVWKNPYYFPNILVYKRMCDELGVFMPWIAVRIKKRMNQQKYREAQRKGDPGTYERWQLLF